DWSMIPQGIPTYEFSPRWASRGRLATGTGRSPRSHRAVRTAHSRAAEDDRPAPTGTSEVIDRWAPGTSYEPSRSSQTTAATYAAQPVTFSPRSNVTVSPVFSECTVHSGRSTRDAATAIRCGSANGST